MAEASEEGTVRSSHGATAWAGFVVLGLMIAGHAVLETARDTLFLTRLPPTQLPVLYLAMAAVTLLIARQPRWVQRSLGGRRELAGALVGSCFLTAGFWPFVGGRGTWALYALYVWTGLYASLVVVQLWLLLDEHFTITEARRAYGFIAAGSLAGASVGAGLARLTVALLDNRFLLIVAAALFLVAASACRLLPAVHARPPRRDTPTVEPHHLEAVPRAPGGLHLPPVLRTPYLRQLGMLAAFAAIAGTSVDFLFKTALVGSVRPERLGAALATTALAQSLLALVVQVVVTGGLLRTVGVTRALLVLPVAIALGSASLAAGGGIVAAFLLRIADASLRPSLHRTSMELLYLPVDPAERREAKPVLEVFGQRVGQALAAVALLASAELAAGARGVALALAALAVGWVAVALAVQEGYLDLFRGSLRAVRVRLGMEMPLLDLHALEELLAALNSRDDGVVLAALEVLAASGRARLIPGLILYHPSSRVVLRAFEVLAGERRPNDVPVMERLLEHADPEVRAAALRSLSTRGVGEEALRRALQDPSPMVRSTAQLGMAFRTCSSDLAASLYLNPAMREPASAAALARAMRAQPSPLFARPLRTLAQHADLEVRREAALALAEQPDPEALPILVEMLGVARLRGAAREALLAHGAAAIEALEQAMGNTALHREIRRAAPGVLARFPPDPEVAQVLVDQLAGSRDGLLRFRALRALGRLRARAPGVRLDGRALQRFLDRTVGLALRYQQWHTGLRELVTGLRPAGDEAPGSGLLDAMLLEKQRFAVERSFRTLTLLRPDGDVWRIYRGFLDLDPRVRAGSRELLETLLRPPLRGALITLVDPSGALDWNLRAQATQYYAPAVRGGEAMLEEMLRAQSAAIQCLAAYCASELGLTRFRPQLEALRTGATPELRDVVERALQRMSQEPLAPDSVPPDVLFLTPRLKEAGNAH